MPRYVISGWCCHGVVSGVVKNGMELLGIEMPERM